MTILSSTPPTITAEDQFTVTNNDEKGVLLKWDGQDYLIRGGETKVVPFDVVRLWFGDPRSVVGKPIATEDRKGNKGDVASRENEVARLLVLWGAYDVGAADLASVVPNVTIKDWEGNDIWTPAIDPFGEHVYGHIENSIPTQDVSTIINRMQAQIDELKAQRDAAEAYGSNDGADVDEDGPRL